MYDTESIVQPSYSYTIGGVRIEMPVKPYPSQISMMDKVIRGCQKHQNCLLESPTGSGKTLALLCSTLAWQKAEKERLEKLLEQEFQQKLMEWQQKERQKKQPKEKIQQKKQRTLEKKPAEPKNVSRGGDDDDDDDSEEEMAVFKQPGKKRKTNKSRYFEAPVDKGCKSSDDSLITDDDSSVNNSLMTEDEDDKPQTENKTPRKPKLITPVIYFCTRTHKQIEQVVKELQRTSFRNVKSCVLASREYTCIQDSNIFHPCITYKSKTELCRDLMDPKARRRNAIRLKTDVDKCSYYDNGGVKISTYEQLAKYGVSSVWDIEDIVSLGRKKNSCPYYGTRLLLKSADIVFCPYNYIIDPVIRGTMKMQLKGHVIIVDEAHNIEDQCREAASLQLDQTNLNLAEMDCEKMSKFGRNSSSYAAIARYLSEMSRWIDQKSGDIRSYDDYNRGVISWSGAYAIASFDNFGIGSTGFEKFKKNCENVLDELMAEENDENQNVNANGDVPSSPFDTAISNATKTLLTSICTVFGFFFDETYKNDYHVSLEKLMRFDKFEQTKRTAANTMDGGDRSNDTGPVWNTVVSFLCLNPAAVFHELKSTARNIILTSGTLSPMQSFQSELGTQFPIALEANHVIKHGQCWVTSVNSGPTGVDLNGQYQNTNTYGFQDEMGQVLKDVCENVPYGVLCFMPSYVLMEKLYARWQVTGLLRELNRTKVVMCEPRRGDRLEGLMDKYYGAIRNASAAGRSGALFLAVYRGKISEGLDFSDNNARAVVAVGIPFPNYKDLAVSHKKDYNNKHHKDKGLLPGWQWYQIQAYRALNQALGRCIRHRNDWGAILLVDSRYDAQPKNLSGLSKWIRGRVENNSSWSTTVAKLKDFVRVRQEEDESKAC